MANKKKKKDADSNFELSFKESDLCSVNPYEFLNNVPSKLCCKSGRSNWFTLQYLNFYYIILADHLKTNTCKNPYCLYGLGEANNVRRLVFFFVISFSH